MVTASGGDGAVIGGEVGVGAGEHVGNTLCCLDSVGCGRPRRSSSPCPRLQPSSPCRDKIPTKSAELYPIQDGSTR